MIKPWMQTRSGKAVDFPEPCAHTIDLDDIIFSLCHQNRYNGHVGGYSVGKHSFIAAQVARELGLSEGIQAAVLMHDAHEAYVGDIVSPLKKTLAPLLDPIIEAFDARIAERFALDTSPDAHIWVAKIDYFMLIVEAALFYPIDKRPRDWQLKELPPDVFTPNLELRVRDTIRNPGFMDDFNMLKVFERRAHDLGLYDVQPMPCGCLIHAAPQLELRHHD